MRVHQPELDLGTSSDRSGNCGRVRLQRREDITREDIEIDLGLIAPRTWPARHKVHKYWGRKPANIVSSYVGFFSSPTELVIDPFAGSAVTVIESALLGRRSIGYDFNPVAVRIGSAILAPPRLADFRREADSIVEFLRLEEQVLYSTRCRRCDSMATVRSIGYSGAEMLEVRYVCSHCGQRDSAPPTEHDLSLASTDWEAPPGTPDASIYYGWEMRKLQRRAVARWRELFTKRNYRFAGLLLKRIELVEDTRVREWLLITLTASLAQYTKMIADYSGKAGGPSWKINCYWLPDKWQELNPLWYFLNRVKKSLSAIGDLCNRDGIRRGLGSCERRDSRHLPMRDCEVDYIFTDPPYGGEGVQYGELSILWNLWLREHADLEKEIAFNPVRGFSQRSYDDGIAEVFAEAYRVLKPGRWMTVTFANKDPEVWDGLLRACREAGFRLVTAAPMKRSAPSLTETTMKRAPKADLVLSFQRPMKVVVTKAASEVEADTYPIQSRIKTIAKLLTEKQGEFTAHDLFDRLTVDWFSWYYENGTRPVSVRPTLEEIEKFLSVLCSVENDDGTYRYLSSPK